MNSGLPLQAPNRNFDDVFDYLEKVRAAKAGEAGNKAKLAEQQRQFGLTNALAQQQLAETSKYHQQSLAQSGSLKTLQEALLKAKIEDLKNPKSGYKNLSAQERTQAMKLLQQGQAAISLINKTNEMEKQLVGHPNLTGKRAWLRNKLGNGGEELGKFTTNAGDIQAGVARLGSQRGGAQALQWAEKIKANDWKDVPTNLGHTRGLRNSTQSDLNDIAAEYEALVGSPYPLKMPSMTANPNTNDEEKTAAPSVGKEHVTEENILHTMEETGLSREQVMAKLKEKGLV